MFARWCHNLKIIKMTFVAALSLVGLMGACSVETVRNAPPAAALNTVTPLASFAPFRVVEQRETTGALVQTHSLQGADSGPILAISGGGQKGAFGAGYLAGWTGRGDRPEFSVVTGISTGSILAVFAFLGPSHDETLKEIYTTYSTRQILKRDFLEALFGGQSAYTAAGYEALIANYIDENILQEISLQAARGRKLIIGTTNLDAQTQVQWDITAIAASGDPQALRLIREIVQASSAIPGLFPPVQIEVHGQDGRVYSEMHVDGGVTEQITIVSPHLESATDITLLVNEMTSPIYHPVRDRALDITHASVASLINGALSADLREISAAGNQSGVPVRIVTIPNSFVAVPSELFDPTYMQTLYELGQATAVR